MSGVVAVGIAVADYWMKVQCLYVEKKKTDTVEKCKDF